MSAALVPGPVRMSIEAMPAVAHAIECAIGAWEAVGRAAAEAAAGDDARFDVLFERTGAHELGEQLAVLCGRLAQALGESHPVHYGREEAEAMLSLLAAWHAEAGR